MWWLLMTVRYSVQELIIMARISSYQDHNAHKSSSLLLQGPAYSRLTSTVVRAEGEEVQAHYYTQLKAYESAPLNPGEPGERYHKLLLAGARGSNLPHPWIDNIISFGYVPFPVLNITDAQQAMIDAQVWPDCSVVTDMSVTHSCVELFCSPSLSRPRCGPLQSWRSRGRTGRSSSQLMGLCWR
ncbi:unnamed protein product [Chrysoparadoxa australica]